MKAMFWTRIPLFKLGLVVGMLVGASSWASEDNYPTRPIKFLVPYAAGGTTDLIARIYAEQLSRRLGQSVVIENRPGAGTNIAGQVLATATPNGYTLMLGTNQAIINSVFEPKPPFDPVNCAFH